VEKLQFEALLVSSNCPFGNWTADEGLINPGQPPEN